MKKLVHALIRGSLVIAALVVVAGCDRNRGNNNQQPVMGPGGFGPGGFGPGGFGPGGFGPQQWGVAPNSCFANGGINRFRWLNGQCVDAQTSQVAAPFSCQNPQMNLINDPRCFHVGGNTLGMGMFNQFGADACSIAYGPGFVTGRGFWGELVCVNTGTWNFISTFYGMNPMLIGGLPQTCVPGGANNFGRCHCRSFGGTLGWVSGGAYIGFCF
jgi:hypothetical protein